MISNMASRILFAALLLASASFGHSRLLAQDSSPSLSPSTMTMEESPASPSLSPSTMTMEESPSSPVIVGPGSDNLTATNELAMATGGALPVVPPSACNATKSPETVVSSGSKFSALLNGTNNIKPNTTGVATPMPGAPRGTYTLVVDESGKKASWTLELCDVPEYVASHLHIGSVKADYPPPLIPLEPYVKPADPFAPPNLLPQLCPPVNITGCSYTAKGSFSEADITPLAGRAPEGDREVPTVEIFADFVKALKDGKIYINIHSKLAPGNLIRGNLFSA